MMESGDINELNWQILDRKQSENLLIVSKFIKSSRSTIRNSTMLLAEDREAIRKSNNLLTSNSKESASSTIYGISKFEQSSNN